MNIFDIFKNEGLIKKIKIYPGYTEQLDPYEKTVEEFLLNPITIKGLISDESMSSLKWKYFGQVPYGSKKVICEAKYENLIKICRKLEIEDEQYVIYKDASVGFALTKKDDYILFIAEKKI